MATRSSSNKGIDARNNAIPPAYLNTQNTQAVRRIPDVSQGMQKELTEQQKAAPLPKEETPKAPARRFSPVDVFAQTQAPSQPITDGAPVGPGRMGATLTPTQRGDLFLKALAQTFPTSDTMALYEEGLEQFELGME